MALRVVRADEGDLFGGVVAAAYGLPADVRPGLAALAGRAGWDCTVAFDGRRPVGAGAAFVDSGPAWLGFGATLPGARRRSAQGRLIALRLRRHWLAPA